MPHKFRSPEQLHVVFFALAIASLILGGWILNEILNPQWRQHQQHYAELVSLRGTGAERPPVRIELHQLRPRQERIDRCTSCHVAIDDPSFQEEPQPLRAHSGDMLEIHRPEQFGCTACHGGDGLATDYERAAHDAIPDWPDPMLKTTLLEARCGSCHVGVLVEGAPRLTAGRKTIADSGCVACHDIPGFDNVRPPRVSLKEIGSKVTRDWLVRWLGGPSAVLPNAKMPTFRIADEDIEAIAGFLMTFKGEQAPLPSGVDPTGGDYDRGETLFRQSMCISCHAVNGKGGTGASDLGYVASKVSAEWLFRFLSNPHAADPETTMPWYRLEGQELIDVVTYMNEELRDWDLEEEQEAEPEDRAVDGTGQAKAEPGSEPPIDPRSVARGRELVGKLGCLGCHAVPGMKNPGKIGTPLDGIGSGRPEHLQFGDDTTTPRTLADWLYTKVRAPGRFDSTARMPSFRLEDDTAAAVTLALMSIEKTAPLSTAVKGKVPPPPYAPPGAFGRIWRRYRCSSCHLVHGSGQNVAEAPLDLEGSQVKAGWLFSFLKEPYTLRPTVTARMPRFNLTDAEIRVLVNHIQSVFVDDSIPEVIDPPLTAEEGKRGEVLFDEFGCRVCHILGGKGGYVGPRLDGAGGRLKPGWIYAWVKDPLQYRPDTIMPNLNLSDADARALAAMLSRRVELREGTAPATGSDLSELILGVGPGRYTPLPKDVLMQLLVVVSDQVGTPIRFEDARSTAEFEEALRLGRYDLIEIDQATFVEIQRAFGFHAVQRVTMPQVQWAVLARTGDSLESQARMVDRKLGVANSASLVSFLLAAASPEGKEVPDASQLQWGEHGSDDGAALALLRGEIDLALVHASAVESLGSMLQGRAHVVLEVMASPEGVIAFRGDAPFPAVDRVRSALAKLPDEGLRLARALGWEEISPATDRDFQKVRELLQTLSRAAQ